MGIAEEFVLMAEKISEHMDLSTVQKFHIDTEETEGYKSSKFGALELTNGRFGLTYVGLGNARSIINSRVQLDDYVGKPVLDLARLYLGREDWQSVLGVAALNAISHELLVTSGYELRESSETLEILNPTIEDHIGMVGYFPPLVEKLRDLGIRLTVIELDASWFQTAEKFKVTHDMGQLAECNKIISTGTTLINQTLEQVLTSSVTATRFVMVGPTVGCLPDPLFKRGVTSVGGRVVEDGVCFIELWAAGKPWRNVTRRYSICKSDYPGYETLLEWAKEGNKG